MTRTDDIFIDLIADEGKELFNGEIATNRVSAPLNSDVSIWVERVIEPKIEEMTLEQLLTLEAELLLTVNQ